MTEQTLAPDIIATVELYPTANGGRKIPISGQSFGCPAQIGKAYFDCRIYLENRVLAPGESLPNVSIKFLSPNLVKPLIKVGDTLHLWESGIFGKATIIEILF